MDTWLRGSDKKDAAAKGILAGVDMDMQSDVYGDYIAQLVKKKKIPLSAINDAVRRILRVKYQLGLFDRPYTDEDAEASAMMTHPPIWTWLGRSPTIHRAVKKREKSFALSIRT